MKLSPEQSLAGILEPVFAIRTEDDLGVGDTEGMRQMIDWCARRGLNVFQTLPINETSDDNSPYNAISSLALEPTTIAIAPGVLPDISQLEIDRISKGAAVEELRIGPVNYSRVKALKRTLLEAAFANFLKVHFNEDEASAYSRGNEPQSGEEKSKFPHAGGSGSERAAQFRAFRMEHADWLSDYVLFRALVEENGGSPAWDRWRVEHQSPRGARAWMLSLPEPRREELGRRQLFFAYVQWIAFTQWQDLKKYAEAQQVLLMGDIPFGVGRHSADVWANRGFFDLDWSGGAPPEKTFKTDPFTAKWGQNWGIPNYRWDELRRNDFDWWRVRVGNVRKMFHLFRIDHVLGLFRIYSFPWTPDRNAEFLPCTEAEASVKSGGRLPGFQPFPDDTPEHKAANQAQGEELLRLIQAAAGDMTVVAEDLGVVPDYVPPTLANLGIPGFRIPMLFREPDWSYSDPRNYPRLSLVQPATHDHTPMARLWAECWANIDMGQEVEHNRWELRRLMSFSGLGEAEPPREFSDELHEAFCRAVLQSNSWLAVFLISDILARSERFNTPGSTSDANWSQRMPLTVSQLDQDPRSAAKAGMFSRLVEASGRRPGR